LCLDTEHLPDSNPWLDYYAMRIAWNDSSASLTRGVLQGAQDIKDERFENLHYLEIANSEERTTILNHGVPFQRTTGMRMVDYILVASGETQRTFRFDICLDENFPMQAAMDTLTPPAVIPSTVSPRGGAETGWFFNVDAKSVQILDILPLREPPSPDLAEWDRTEIETTPHGNGFALRLVETEGRAVRVKVRCFRDPVEARQRDFQGRTISDVTIEGDAVFIDMTAFEIADIELRF
jgi:alpha-mannosidase